MPGVNGFILFKFHLEPKIFKNFKFNYDNKYERKFLILPSIMKYFWSKVDGSDCRYAFPNTLLQY